MQTSNQDMNKKKLNKSQILLIGSFLIFTGILIISKDYFSKLKEELYSNMKLKMNENLTEDLIEIEETKYDINISQDQEIDKRETKENNQVKYQINWDQYLGILEIPKIGLKKGFYNLDNKYNDIKYNVTMLEGSSMPDQDRGNLLLMAHSGNAWISYFAYLYKLNIGDSCFITYNGVQYEYKIVDIYNVDKIGIAVIRRNEEKRCLTLITCTKDDDKHQTIYVAEQVQ